ncbi:RNA-DNA hybrid ribonuclease [Coemansia guatemalensis]|uniref:RNA-DNA hybrid ribonuclease n=1 Tax=Coemansia guatemalensis TaxID=2761395 RepID=A0A9W8HXI9_9FUNG|nr:RNA-DNA hybrid ribonuclease [Coemansia guatemalensis]
MDLYMSVLLNMRSKGRGKRGSLVLESKDPTFIENNRRRIDIDDEAEVRSVIQQISSGNFAHLPPLRSLKVLFSSPQHQKLLQRTYNTLRIANLSIDEVAARVLSIIVLSRQCRCRHLQLRRCSFTDSGRKILFSALSMMAEPLTLPRTSSSAEPACTRQKISCMPSNAADTDDLAPMGLYSLELSQMGLTDKRCAWFSNVLEQQPYLQSLNLRDNLIGIAGIRRIVAALARGCHVLKSLNLSGNILRSPGVHLLTQYLITAGQTLESLDISSNEISLNGAQDIAHALSTEIGLSLKSLNLDMNQLEADGCELLGRTLAHNTILELLVLSRNNIFDNGCQLLFEGLSGNTALQTLDIGGNFITHIGARSIQIYLEERQRNLIIKDKNCGLQSGLRTLNISNNSIGDEGITSLCQGLQTNCHMVGLIANKIDITDIGAHRIRQLLETCACSPATLLTLSLRHNHRISRVGFEEIAKGSSMNRQILRIVADMQFESWSAVWAKVETSLILNTILAIERYKAPLLMVARGRIILRDATLPANSSSKERISLPYELRWLILAALDRHQVLKPDQRQRALRIACTPARHYYTRSKLLAEILGSDYPFVIEMMKTIHA